jgi:hypothetical protein
MDTYKMEMYTKYFFDIFKYIKNAFQIKGAYAPENKKSHVILVVNILIN